MTTEEASELWGLHQDYIKRLCVAGTIVAEKKAKTWWILRDQPNPRQRGL
ncbi:helix-turn-helix domain-containing protein [Paenibacillus faecalis]